MLNAPMRAEQLVGRSGQSDRSDRSDRFFTRQIAEGAPLSVASTNAAWQWLRGLGGSVPWRPR
jgi:hypothetical protein